VIRAYYRFIVTLGGERDVQLVTPGVSAAVRKWTCLSWKALCRVMRRPLARRNRIRSSRASLDLERCILPEGRIANVPIAMDSILIGRVKTATEKAADRPVAHGDQFDRCLIALCHSSFPCSRRMRVRQRVKRTERDRRPEEPDGGSRSLVIIE